MKQVDTATAHRETFDGVGGAIMKRLEFIGRYYKCHIKTDVV